MLILNTYNFHVPAHFVLGKLSSTSSNRNSKHLAQTLSSWRLVTARAPPGYQAVACESTDVRLLVAATPAGSGNQTVVVKRQLPPNAANFYKTLILIDHVRGPMW